MLVWFVVSIELVLQILMGVLNLSSAIGTPGPGALSEIKAHPTSQLTRQRDGETERQRGGEMENSAPQTTHILTLLFFATQHCIPSTYTHMHTGTYC